MLMLSGLEAQGGMNRLLGDLRRTGPALPKSSGAMFESCRDRAASGKRRTVHVSWDFGSSPRTVRHEGSLSRHGIEPGQGRRT